MVSDEQKKKTIESRWEQTPSFLCKKKKNGEKNQERTGRKTTLAREARECESRT